MNYKEQRKQYEDKLEELSKKLVELKGKVEEYSNYVQEKDRMSNEYCDIRNKLYDDCAVQALKKFKYKIGGLCTIFKNILVS